jgi:hypothetical protein
MTRALRSYRTFDGAADVHCAGCGAHYRREEWTTLTLAARIAPNDIRSLIIGWPDHACIEVRVCVACGHEIPAKCDVTPLA